MEKTMRKIKVLLLAVLMLTLASPSFAAVGVKKDGAGAGTATDLNFRNAGNAISSDGSTLTFNLMLAGYGNGGGTSMIDTDTVVPVGNSVVRKAISTTVGLAGSLVAGSYQGQLITIRITARAGSGTFLLRPTTPSSDYTTIAFDGVDDSVTLLWDSAWYVVDGRSVTIQ